jgi:hypothetical protein
VMREDIMRAKLSAALKEFFREEHQLLESGIREEALAHQLARHIRTHFDGWHVDTEYDKLHEDGIPAPKKYISSDGTEQNAIPDIIVHRRQVMDNLLAIEIKKVENRRGRKRDYDKLRAYRLPPYSYQYAVFLELGWIVQWVACAQQELTPPSFNASLRALVSELLFEVVIVNPEGQSFFGETLIDPPQDIPRRIAGHIAGAQQRRKTDRVVQIVVVFNGGRVVRHAADAGAVQLALHRLEFLRRRLAEQHEFAARHLDLANLQTLQLHDHVIDREAVIGVRPDAKIELPCGGRRYACRCDSQCDRSVECSSSHQGFTSRASALRPHQQSAAPT